MTARIDVVNGFALVSKTEDGAPKYELFEPSTGRLVFESDAQSECLEVSSVITAVRNVISNVREPNPVADLIYSTLTQSLESRGIGVEEEPASVAVAPEVVEPEDVTETDEE